MSIVDGTRECQVLTNDATEEIRLAYQSWICGHANAAGMIAVALEKSVASFVLTYTTALEIWNKLLNVFEQTTEQRLSMLMKVFLICAGSSGRHIGARGKIAKTV